MTLLLGALGWNGGTAEDGGGTVVFEGGAAEGAGWGAEEVGTWNNLLASSFRFGGALAGDVAAVDAFEGVGDGAAVDEAAVVAEGDWTDTEPNALAGGYEAGASFDGGGVPAEPFTTDGTAVALAAAAEGPEGPFASIVPKLMPEDL